MYEHFKTIFPPCAQRTEGANIQGPVFNEVVLPQSYVDFIATEAVSCYGNGVLRFFLSSTPLTFSQWNSSRGFFFAWPSYANRLVIFASDWLGRQIAFDTNRQSNDGEPMISIVEPGAGELLEVPVGFEDFMNVELVHYHNDALATNFYQEWLTQGGHTPDFQECAGYNTPLFLGGVDTIANLSIQNMDVYVTLCGEMLGQV